MKRFISQSTLLLCSATLVTTSFMPILAHAQRGSAVIGLPVAGAPGQYNMVNQADIEKNRIDWSMALQKQDQEQYTKATTEAQAAYEDLYKNGLIPLRKIYNETFIGKSRIATPVELAAAIDAFVTRQDLFGQKIAALETVAEVWQSMAAQPAAATTKENNQLIYVYQRGSLNFKAFTKTYRDGIATMIKEASNYTYNVNNGATMVSTKPGEGLTKIGSVDTPEFMAKQLEIFQEKARLTEEDQEQMGRIALEFKRQMAQFTNATDLRLYWFNTLQDQTRKDWVASLEKKARVAQFARAAYCMPIGVPALDIPKLQKFNVGYLSRDMKNRIRLVEKAEFDSAAIKATLTRFDEWFTSLQSQNGDFDNVGGIMGYVHKLNSTFAWHNEVAAYITIAKILRDMYVDERDIADSPVEGCEKVRARYYARYVSFKDPVFLAEANRFLQGTVSADPAMQAFNAAGKIIITKGAYQKEYFKMIKQNPTASLLGKSIMEDDDLK